MLNSISGGRISLSSITFTSLFAHFPTAYFIAVGKYELAAGLLLVFGLFDALDGAMARLQNKASSSGMLLDASTDRIKEVILYCGVSYALIATNQPYYAVWAVAACGASLCVSYIKAKGETAVIGSGLSPNQINRLFADGLVRFEIRMALLILGLLANRLAVTVVVIAILSSMTALGRLMRITKKLSDVQD